MADQDNNSGINPALLPPQLRKLVRVIGFAETLKLVQAKGGVPVYIAANPTTSCQFDGILSNESVIALAKEFGGERIDLPKADKLLAQLRDLYIIQKNGSVSGRKLAKELNITWRRIKQIRASAKVDSAQSDLFDLDKNGKTHQA